ncbi:MAG: hypothetical protein BRD51_04190 [Bacteroidetes bacterium SW_11_64_17]|nr:MAG: hypothetical protein BRD51_04190 [Bacteroidetes bacterium SW_11_64_17]
MKPRCLERETMVSKRSSLMGELGWVIAKELELTPVKRRARFQNLPTASAGCNAAALKARQSYVKMPTDRTEVSPAERQFIAPAHSDPPLMTRDSQSMTRLPRTLLLGLLIPVTLSLALMPTANAQDDATDRLHQLFDEAWTYRLQEHPLFATSVGVHDYNDELPTVSVEAAQQRLDRERTFLDRLRDIDRSALSSDEQLNYDLFERVRKRRIAELEHRSYLIPITNRSGFHVSFPQLPDRVPLNTVADYEDYIARLNAFDRYAQQHTEIMQAGLNEGYALPKVVLQDADETIRPQVVDDPTESQLYDPFDNFSRSHRRGGAHAAARGRDRRHRHVRGAGLRVVPPLHDRDVHPKCPRHDPGWGTARRRSLLRAQGASPHDPRPHAPADPRDGQTGGAAHSEADDEHRRAARIRRRFRRLRRVSPHRRPVLCGLGRGTAKGNIPHSQAHGRQAARTLRDAAAHVVRHPRGPRFHCPTHHHGLLPASGGRRHAGRILLCEHARSAEPPALRDRGALST